MSQSIKIQEAVVLDDIEIIQNKYVMCLRKVLGKGSYAFVYQGYMKENENEQIAIKIIQKLGTEQKRKSFDVLSNFIKREKLNHGKLQSENIVKMIDFVEDEGSIYFILEFCEEKSLSDKLISGPLKENEALWIFKQVLNGYRELIESNIIHRDLKPENILFSKGIAKIGDFGFSIYLDDLNTTSDHTKLGTPLYTAPEISTGKYSSKADIWSLGVILYQMLYGYVPFDISVPKDLEKSKKLPIKYPNTISVDVIALLQKMLVVDQNQRISWQDLFAENLVGLIKAQQSQIQDQVTQSKVIKIDQKLDKEMKVQNIYNYFIYVSDILTFIRSLICEISKLQTAVKFSKEQIKHYNIITTKYLLNEIKFYLRVLNGEMLMQLLILPNDFQLFKKSDQYYQVLNNFKCNSETLEQFYQKIKEAYDKYFQQIQVQNTNKEIIKQFEFYSEGLKQNENNSKFYEAFNTIYLNLVDHIIEKVNHQKVLIEEKDHLFRTLIKLLHCFQPLQFSHHKLEAFKVEQKLRTSSSLEKEFNELYYQLLSKS
ncbi:unnamed protein product [Paramecium sonneborni]|uniref:Protein kinase domain-containing protein n=1 Tax=Paramecium sonneborni TaxID=65129 RepID=A0A8S1R710_9CILI|nr:unnamed protein product [Paramecium sonneborni]